MRKLPCLYPSKVAVGGVFGAGRTNSQETISIRTLSRHRKHQHNTTSVRTEHLTKTSRATGISGGYFLEIVQEPVKSSRDYQTTFSKRLALTRSLWRLEQPFDGNISGGFPDHLFKFATTLTSFFKSLQTICPKFNIASLSTLSKCYLVVTKDIVVIGAHNRFLASNLIGTNSARSLLGRSGITGTNLYFSRQMSSNARGMNTTMNEPREISFKTPYGHIACLEWGQREAPTKILCAHGWLDNAGSFEPLVPFILNHKDNASKYHIVAMDMPGVGHSSHRPPAAEYTIFSHIIEMRRVTQQLGWNQNLILLGHSMGGHLSFIYSCVYPKQVASVISIDTTHPLTHQAANWHVTIGNNIEHYFKCEHYGHNNEKLDTVTPVYTEADAIKRLMDAHSNSLTLEAAKVMFKRGATKHPNGGCTFNRDVRLRHMSVEFRPDDELMLKFLEHSFKPHNLLIIRGLGSPYHRPDEIRLRYYSLFERNCRLFRDVMLDGTHHLHMNSPDSVAIEINKFLEDAELARMEASEASDDGSPTKPNINKPNL